MRSQEFLSALEIPYWDCPGQAAIDKKAQDVINVFKVSQVGTYSPPVGPLGYPFDSAIVAVKVAADIDYKAAARAGNIEAAHRAHERFNQAGGGPYIGPASDMQILRNGHNSAADVARWALDLKGKGERVMLLDEPDDVQKLIAEFGAKAEPLPAPPMSVMAPPWDTVPVGTVVTAPDGARWRRESSLFGGVYYRV